MEHGKITNNTLTVVDLYVLRSMADNNYTKSIESIEKDANLTEEQKVGFYWEIRERYDAELFKLCEYKPVHYDQCPETTDIQSVETYYEEDETDIYVRYVIVDADSYRIEAKIERLKQELSTTDYKVQKNNEYRDAGQPLPYDPVELFTHRQPIRDEINRLETILKNQ